MLHSFFNPLEKSRYLSFFSQSFNSTVWSVRTAKSTILQLLFFLLILIRSGRLAQICWSVYISKSQSSLCVLFSRIDSGLCIHHLFVWSNTLSRTILSGSPCPPSCTESYTLCVHICCILILCDWSFVSFTT